VTFPAHWAPLDMKFNANGSTAWITAHGSWNRDDPDGYLLYAVAFNAATGMPTEPADSTSAVIPIMSNVDNSKCPDGCFRPVGLAFDRRGRLFMTSDSTGEIYVITRTDGGSVNSATPTTGSGPASATSSRAAAAGLVVPAIGTFGSLFAAVVLTL
jgi:glucose/arabinose dehydrogenase